MNIEDHCYFQRMIVNRLYKRGYNKIQQNFEFKGCREKPLMEEIDILAYSPKGRWHFYEIELNEHKIEIAREKYMSFKNANPSLKIRGVYISPHKVTFL